MDVDDHSTVPPEPSARPSVYALEVDCRWVALPPLLASQILCLFSPTLSPTATLTGAEFFAALRLVVHAVNGRDVERSLAFVQANPGTSVRPLYRSAPPSPTNAIPNSPFLNTHTFHNRRCRPSLRGGQASLSPRLNPRLLRRLEEHRITPSPPLICLWLMSVLVGNNRPRCIRRRDLNRVVPSFPNPILRIHSTTPFAQARSSRSDNGSGSAPNPKTIPPLPPRIPSSRRGERSLSSSKPLLTPHPLLSNITPSLIHPDPQATTAPFTHSPPPPPQTHH